MRVFKAGEIFHIKSFDSLIEHEFDVDYNVATGSRIVLVRGKIITGSEHL